MSTAEARTRPRLLTIGAVCRRLKPEFPDVSISKIRYLEGEGLVTPRRTQGGYRLFSEDDLERLETILRLQRDEFLPLRVIRQQLASPPRATGAASARSASPATRRSSTSGSSASTPRSTNASRVSSRSTDSWRRAP